MAAKSPEPALWFGAADAYAGLTDLSHSSNETVGCLEVREWYDKSLHNSGVIPAWFR